MASGYTHCACRDCFDTAISNDMADPELCSLCEDAGCTRETDALDSGCATLSSSEMECQRSDAYGCDDHNDLQALADTLSM